MTTYYTHDNGGRAFKVLVEPDHITIYQANYDESMIQRDRIFDQEPVHVISNYLEIFVGKDPDDPRLDGNSLLVCIEPHQYVFIGWKVISFKTPDQITTFVSPVWGSDVPYPYAIGDQNTYLLTEDLYIPNYLRDEVQNPYDQYYGPRGGIPEKYSTYADAVPQVWDDAITLSKLYEPIRKFYEQFATDQRVLVDRP